MIFCTKCGTQLDDNAKFCYNCGAAVLPIEAPAPQPVPQQAPQAEFSQPVPQPVPQQAPQAQFSQPAPQPFPQQGPQAEFPQTAPQPFPQQGPQAEFPQPAPQPFPQQAPQYARTVPQQGQQPPQQKKNKKGLIIALIIAGAVLVVGAIVLLIMLFGGGEGENSSDNSSNSVVSDTSSENIISSAPESSKIETLPPVKSEPEDDRDTLADFVPSFGSYFGLGIGVEIERDMLEQMSVSDSGIDLDSITYVCYGVSQNDIAAIEEYCEYIEKRGYDIELINREENARYYTYSGNGSVKNINLYGYSACFAINYQSIGDDVVAVMVVYSNDLTYGDDHSRSDYDVKNKNVEVSEFIYMSISDDESSTGSNTSDNNSNNSNNNNNSNNSSNTSDTGSGSNTVTKKDFFPSVESYLGVSKGHKLDSMEYLGDENLLCYVYAFSPDNIDYLNKYCEYLAGGKYDLAFYSEPDEYFDMYFYSYEYTGSSNIYTLYGECAEIVILDISDSVKSDGSKTDMIIMLVAYSKDLKYGDDGSRGGSSSIVDKTSKIDDEIMEIVTNWLH
ncbi:MAG: zinc ribbon domain-containing protein [Eubacterium sp.]|nr:zinc ribbon domain-containing protein [Eubacterium sp.]